MLFSHLNISEVRCLGKPSSQWTYLLLLANDHQNFQWVSVAWRKIPRARVELLSGNVYSPIYLKAQKPILCEKNTRWQRFETESDLQDSDSSIKCFKNTLTNLLCNLFSFNICAGMIYGTYLYLNKSKRVLTINYDYVFKIRIHCMHAQLCLTLCNPVDSSLPGSSVHGILQTRKLKQVAISYSRGFSRPRNPTHISCISCVSRCILYHCTTWGAL